MFKVLVILLTFLRFQSIASSSNQTLWFSYSRNLGENGNKYKHTLHNLLTTFSSQATTTNTGFYNSTLFNRLSNDNTYGLYLCRGDIDRQSCRACVNSAKQAILSKRYTTNYGDEAMFWYDHCMIRYSNKPITGILDVNTSMWATWDMSNVTGNYVTRFPKILMNTMNLLSVQAATGRSGKKFATRIVKLTEDESLYGLAQCTPDLTVNDCRKCLVTTIEKLDKMGSSKSGKVVQLNCMVRYEMFPFFYTDKIRPFESSAVNLTQIRLRVRLDSYNNSVNSTSSSPSSVFANTPAVTAFKVQVEISPLVNGNRTLRFMPMIFANSSIIKQNGNEVGVQRE